MTPERHVWAVEVALPREGGAVKMERGGPVTWSVARAEATKYERLGYKARVVDLRDEKKP